MASVKITYFAVDGLGRRSRLGGDTLNLGSSAVTSVNAVPTGTTEARLVANGAGQVAFGATPNPAAAGFIAVRSGVPLTLTIAKGQIAAGQVPAAIAAPAAADISNAAVTDFMTRWHATLPTSQPAAGTPGWWSNGGMPTFFAG